MDTFNLMVLEMIAREQVRERLNGHHPELPESLSARYLGSRSSTTECPELCRTSHCKWVMAGTNLTRPLSY